MRLYRRLLRAPADRERLRLGLRIGFSVAAVVLLMWWGDLFVNARLGLNNVYHVPRDTSDHIIIVAIDDASLQAYGRSIVEWPRALYADLVDKASAGGARVVAFDVLFSETTDGDAALIEAITRARTESEARTRVVMPLVGAQREPDSSEVLYAHFLKPTEALQAVVTALGHTNTLMDPDGTVRRQPTLIMAGGEDSLSFSLVTYLTYLRIPPAAFSQVVQYRDDKREMRIASARRIPLDDQGQMLINFFNAPDEDAFPAFSFKDVVEGRVDPDVFYDRIVLVGLHHHAGLNDMYAVPIGLDGSLMAGVEIHANVIETLLQNKPLREQGPLSQAIMIVGLSVLSSLLYSFASRRGYWMLIALFGALAIWFGGVFIYFNVQQVMVNLFHALLALILPAPIIIIANAVIETQQRQRAEWLLGSMLAASNQRLSLAGILPGVADDLRRILETQDVEIWLCDASGRDTKRAYPIRGPMDAPRRELIGRAIAGKTQLYHAGQLAIPLTWQGETLGAFWVLRQRRLPSAARRLLDLFVWQTASIIANAVLYTQTEELSNLKTRLLRMASHDLKNPLAAIIMGCEMLAERDPNWVLLSERQLKYIEIIQNSAQRMNQLVNDILDLERVRAGEHTIAPYDLAMILREVAESHKASAQFRHHTFIEEIPATFPSLSGNVTQIRQALSNLVGNAIKYTPEGGQITIRLEQQPHVARISVADTGYGIPEEAQPHLFREFYRAQTPDTIEIEGTGLGLSLVKAVIETHRGRVWFESAEGIGSTFYVELPIPARGE